MMPPAVRLKQLLTRAGLLGMTAVLAGRFGSHRLKGMLSEEMLATFEIGVRYHLSHAVAVPALAAFAMSGRENRWITYASRLMTMGVIIFSGSLHALALTNQRWLGMITPFGGVALIAGWALILFAARRLNQKASG